MIEQISAKQWVVWIVGTLITASTAVAYVFTNFETKDSARESKDSIERRLDRIENKIDVLNSRLK